MEQTDGCAAAPPAEQDTTLTLTHNNPQLPPPLTAADPTPFPLAAPPPAASVPTSFDLASLPPPTAIPSPHPSPVVDQFSYTQGNWSLREILVLLEAKAAAEQAALDAIACLRSSGDKWRLVSELCHTHGVNRSKEQCKVKWDNMMPEFRKVRDYEQLQQRPSYFAMEAAERRAKLLPSNMDMAVYQRIAEILSLVRANRGCAKRGKKELPELPQRASSPSPSKRRRRQTKETAREAAADTAMAEKLESSSATGDEDDGDGGVIVVASRSRRGLPPPAISARSFCLNPSKQGYHVGSPTGSSYSGGQGVRSPAQGEGNDVGGEAKAMGGEIEKGGSGVGVAGEVIYGGGNMGSGGGDTGVVEAMSRKVMGEDRKDARHQEMVALEREKVMVLREASYAMANAVAMFAKVGEDLLRRLRLGRGGRHV